MIKDITIGQFFPGNSFLHRMDARMKLVLLVAMIVLIFVSGNAVSLALSAIIVLSIVAFSKISFKMVFKGLKPILFIVAFTALINLFYGTGKPIAEFWIFKITLEGIYNAVFMAVRIVLLVIIGSMLTYTTSPTALTDGIESLMKPLKYIKVDVHTIAMTMTIALRFIPTLIEEIDKITAAQKSRGADMESGNLVHRAKALIPILIPLFVSSFRRAGELAYAMECRCYRGGDGRTKMKQMKCTKVDYAALAFVVVAFVAVILLNTFVPPIF